MENIDNAERLELALLPLADGRRVAIPLTLLAEVRQIKISSKDQTDLGCFKWRGHDLLIHSLEEMCGLPAPSPEEHMTVGVLRASRDASQPFRAIAFCGLASHRMLDADQMQDVELPAEGTFRGAAEVDGETYLVPDLSVLTYDSGSQLLH